MKFEKIKAGMTLYDVHSQKMGNTTMRSVGVWFVQILSVDAEKRCATVIWNCNPPRVMSERKLSKLREKEPLLIRSSLGRSRLATRAEIAALKATASATQERETA